MSRDAVEELLYVIDQSFEGDGSHEHALLTNLSSVTDADWLWVPPGGRRSIRQITGHVGACVYGYDSRAFGDGTMSGEDRAGDLGCTMDDLDSAKPLDPEPPRERVIAWIAEGHRRWREHVAALDDEGLLQLRPHHRGEAKALRWQISIMLQHDLYHAGEINHIRALRQRNDRWAWDIPAPE